MPPNPAGPVPSEGGTSIGTSAASDFFSLPRDTRALTCWGSSSMAFGRADEGTPLTARLSDRLALALAPAPVANHAVGATLSIHSLLQRGLETPTATPASSGAGTVRIALDPEIPPRAGIEFPADIAGVAGRVTCSASAWSFTPEDPAAATPTGILTSHLGAESAGSRHLLWIGKNNIRDVQGVLAHTQAMWDAADSPAEDTLVLGQWPTPSDPHGSDTGDALRAVNAEQASRYGDRFLDIAGALADPEALSRGPVAALRLMEQGGTHDAIAQGIAPPELMGSDDIHLNGWGNLFVLDLLLQRMKELRWL
ncbi:hypothetical protein BF93_01050 [Brachybacterium phenoliresistens]|uniref:SGNH hydrolase-type esterase domain-containing protein n=1 Tax=Brachybacterium phenoliresistens TaxID=396014 RepID=Z9JT56_9MICO|nr:hypothetical protein [Brachybacterium phenoliresistens]EWS80981.1 hypothetical protein BF93_01050 [Brachybacterium phenoliresistens]